MFTGMKDGAARGDRVDRLRDEALAGPVLTRDEDVRIGRAHPRDEVEDRPHRGGLRDEGRPLLAAQELVLLLQPPVSPHVPRARSGCARSRAAGGSPTAWR